MPESATQRQRTLDLHKCAEDVFGDAGIAKRRLAEPNLATDERAPLALLDSENGFARVKTLLDPIDYGVLA